MRISINENIVGNTRLRGNKRGKEDIKRKRMYRKMRGRRLEELCRMIDYECVHVI